MSFSRVILPFFLFPLPSLGQSFSFSKSVQIIAAGQFHKDEFDSTMIGEWYGVFAGNVRNEIKKVNIKAEKVHDPILDQDESVKTGWLIKFKDDISPVFLFRGIEGSKEGIPFSAPTIYKTLFPDETQKIDWRNPTEKIIVKVGGTSNWQGLFLNYSITVIFQQKQFEIARFERLGGDGMPALVWVGDLDEDEKPDFLFELTDHYNKSEITLFLSSHAQSGAMLKKVASFRKVGC